MIAFFLVMLAIGMMTLGLYWMRRFRGWWLGSLLIGMCLFLHMVVGEHFRAIRTFDLERQDQFRENARLIERVKWQYEFSQRNGGLQATESEESLWRP